jgi:2-oxo-3-hexenedioate decarboxylase
VTARPPAAIARELQDAYATRTRVAPPSSIDSSFALDDGYAVEAEVRRLRRNDGRRVVGVKVGYANRAVWRALKLQTLVWAAMYDDTVRQSAAGAASIDVSHMISPKIEPEIILKLARRGQSGDASAVLESVEWIAPGFEIIDCPFPEWKFQPADFVAALGLHAALIVGEPKPVSAAVVPQLVEQLSTFTLRLFRNGILVEEGAGTNALKSPANCLAELAAAAARNPVAETLEPGHLVSTGTLTTSQPCAAGEVWTVEVAGLDVAWPQVRLN